MNKELLKLFTDYLIENKIDIHDGNRMNHINNFINSAQGENSNVSDNETKGKKCRSVQTYFEDCNAHGSIYCDGCKYLN